MKDKITYIFGHKNPDTDSICAAISLSYLKNKLGIKSIPMTLGSLNEETKFVLKYFKIDEPHHLNDVKIQLKDINYHKKCFIDKNISIKDAFDYINKYSLTGIPVVEEKNKYYGYVSLKEISRELIMYGSNNRINSSYGNILKILNGNKILKFDKEIDGEIIDFNNRVKYNSSSIIISNFNEEIIKNAISSKAKLIILISDNNLTNDLYNFAVENKVNVIGTPFSLYEVSKLISFSNYVKNILRKEETPTFNEADYLSEFLRESKKFKHTNYPILNRKGECTGLLTLTDCNNVNKKRVILVDHNNYSQSVEGLDEAEILEVIDHHNIGDIVTKMPINFRNARVGSVNTIIYEMFVENNVTIPKNIAGIMASAIISDTLLLTSPTTTQNDINALNKLSKIAGINFQTYGIKLLKQGMSIKGLSNKEILYKDFKSYKVEETMIGIGQVLTSDYDLINKDEMIKYLDEVAENNNYRVLTLFVTDIFNNISHCLYNKSSEDIIKRSFDLKDIYEGVELKDIKSRKIQIAPYIMDTIEKE